MKFTTAIFAVTLLASAALAVPTAEANPGRAGKLTKWCVTPGQMCYKSKRDLEDAVDYIASGYEAPHPEVISKREAFPKRFRGSRLDRAGKLTKWCVGPGQMCYKSKRDLDQTVGQIAAGEEITNLGDFDETE